LDSNKRFNHNLLLPAGGPGVQRWLKFVKYLPDFGIQPIVYVPENPTYPIVDANLIKEVSDKAIVLKQKIFEPYQLASFFSKNKTKKISSGIIPNQKKQSFVDKLFLLIRETCLYPMPVFYGLRPLFLEKYIIENNIETIITSGPPHTHLIGLELKRKLDLTWFADFRDPWTTIGYHKALRLSNYATKSIRC
jgi:hypothetical protein